MPLDTTGWLKLQAETHRDDPDRRATLPQGAAAVPPVYTPPAEEHQPYPTKWDEMTDEAIKEQCREENE